MATVLRGGRLVGPGRDLPSGSGGYADVWLRDGRITAIEPSRPGGPHPDAGGARPDVPAADGAAPVEVIDARGKLVLPGLVDSHRHTWQTALRQVGAGWTLDAYRHRIFGPVGRAVRPADVYTGTLLGAYTALDAGITTIVDWAHVQNSPAHTDAGIAALRDAGVRAVFGHGWSAAGGIAPDQPHPADLRRVRERLLPHDDALVTLAMAARGPDFATLPATAADFALARDLGVPLTVHLASAPPGTGQRGIERLAEAGLLGADLTVVHATGASDRAVRMLAEYGVGASVSPQIELTMPGFGGAVALARLRAAGVRVGLSSDSETSAAGDLFTQLKFAFAVLRAAGASAADPAPADVLSWATVDGAAVAGLSGRTGELTVGAAADLILVDATAVNLTPANDPAASVVLAAHPGNVDTVLVAGRVVKRGGRLVADLDRVRGAAGRSARRLGAALATAP